MIFVTTNAPECVIIVNTDNNSITKVLENMNKNIDINTLVSKLLTGEISEEEGKELLSRVEQDASLKDKIKHLMNEDDFLQRYHLYKSIDAEKAKATFSKANSKTNVWDKYEVENDAELEKLCTDSVELINYARNIVVKHVNIVQIMTYYSLGRWIVETQQMGEKRAKYGSKVIKTLSENLQKEFGKGFSEDTLKNARKFYLTYKERISETVFSLFAIEKSETVFSFFEKEPPFIVSWSHYLQLMRIENEAERSFYEIETAKTGWGVRTLQRQYNSSLYERLALSRDKEGVLRLASEGNVITKPEDIIKQPTVLEFLGMEEKAKYSETDLETALINKLQKFLLELGKGYLFEARQKRFTYDEDNFYVDLVFYNRLLRCYVLIDLKVDKLTHQDIGQMQMYVNYYDRYEKLEDENPTIGILLCKEKNDALVEITLPKDANIYASEYKLYLPDKKLLQQKLKEWIEEEEE